MHDAHLAIFLKKTFSDITFFLRVQAHLNNNNNKSLFSGQPLKTAKGRPIFKIQYTYDTNIDKIQIHNTDPNVCHMNSKKKQIQKIT